MTTPMYEAAAREALRTVSPEIPQLAENLDTDVYAVQGRLEEALGSAVMRNLSAWNRNKLERYTILSGIIEPWGRLAINGNGAKARFIPEINISPSDGHKQYAMSTTFFHVSLSSAAGGHADAWLYPEGYLNRTPGLWQQAAARRHDLLARQAYGIYAAQPAGEAKSQIDIATVYGAIPTEDLGYTTTQLISWIHNNAPRKSRFDPNAKHALAHDLVAQTNAQAGVNIEQKREPLTHIKGEIVPTQNGGRRIKSRDAAAWKKVFPASLNNASLTLQCPARHASTLIRARHAALNAAFDYGLFKL